MEPPFSKQFGDIYFSVEDGLAETRHVFLTGNGLPEGWQGKDRFTIAETGFGTGLNFLSAWTLFEETADAGAVLDYIAVELYPLAADEILAALSRWSDAFGGRLERLARQWPMNVPGFHRLHFGRVRLTLIFDDVTAALPQVVAPRGVDAWFLDGFAPAKNPQMWTDVLYSEMARLSAPGAHVATFTAAGAVRRGLADAGFAVEKVSGFGRKRDMTVARFAGQAHADFKRPQSIAIIGGGLAGTACAFALKRRGFAPVIFEQANALATGASGNALGLCNPRFSAQRTPEAQFYTAAYALAHRTFGTFADAGFNPCGSLHLVNNADKEKRFHSMLQSWGWNAAHMELLDAGQASDAAGIKIDSKALLLPQSMQINPAALCRAYADGTTVHFHNGNVPDTYDAVIVANGTGALETGLPLHTVRGQATTVRGRGASLDLRTNICFGGYISAPYGGGLHMVGSSFQKWLGHTDLLPQDDADNLARLAENMPSLAQDYEVMGARAGLRIASRDHFPVAGRMGGRMADGTYISAAHGSHGILSSLAAAELIADEIDGSPASLPAAVRDALSPARFKS